MILGSGIGVTNTPTTLIAGTGGGGGNTYTIFATSTTPASWTGTFAQQGALIAAQPVGGYLPPPDPPLPRPNRFLVGHDLLEAFFRHMSEDGIGRAELLELPVELFVSWLIMEAATADGEEIPDTVLPPKQKLAFLRQAPRTLPAAKPPAETPALMPADLTPTELTEAAA